MGPHQIVPSEEWRARQFLPTDGAALHKGTRAPEELSLVPRGGAPKSAFLDQSKLAGTADVDDCENICFSDVEDALDDDDDEGVGLGNNWCRREFTPKRGVEIFVGGLTRSTRRNMLQDWFQHAGEVTEVRIARDKRRRRCRGYGYVRFATSEQANRAIETMHRFEFKHGRFLGVLPSDENRTLFVGGLRDEWSCLYITNLLKEMMPGLRKVEPIPDREDRLKIRTFCFLEFDTHKEAAAIYNKYHVDPPPPPQEQQQQLGHPSRDSFCQEKAPLSTCAANMPKGHSSAFERDARMNSSGTSSISCSSGCVGGGTGGSTSGGCCGGCGSLGIPEGAEGGTDCVSPTAASLTPSSNVSSARRARGDTLPADAEGLLEDSYCGNDGGWWPGSVEDPGGGDGNVENASSRMTTPQPDIGEKALAAWEEEMNRNGESVSGSGNRGVPLVVDGAVLKVDWADPLRYHIHLNGGIKGPSAHPGEVGMSDGRPMISRGSNNSSIVARVIPIGVHGRASYGQVPWQVPQQLRMRSGTWGGGLSETDDARTRRMEYDQLWQQQHQAQQPVHPLYEQQHGTHRVEVPSGQSAASRSVTAAGDWGYGISNQRVSDASSLYRDASFPPLRGHGQQEDFRQRTKTTHHLFSPSQHLPSPDQDLVHRAPHPPPDVADVRRLRRPSFHEQQRQLRGAHSDRSPSVPFDDRPGDADVGWRLVRDVDTSRRGSLRLGAGRTVSYSVDPEASGSQDAFPGPAIGIGGGFSDMQTFAKTRIRSDVSPVPRRDPLPQTWRAGPTRLSSSWDGRIMDHRSPLANEMATSRLDSGEHETFVERRGEEDGRVAEGYHFGIAYSRGEGSRGYASAQCAQQRQQNQNQFQQQPYQHQRREQGWADEVGDHCRRQRSGSMIDQVQDSLVTSQAQLSRSSIGHPGHLPMFDHASTHYSAPLSVQEQQQRQRRELLASGGMLSPNAQSSLKINGIVEATGCVFERDHCGDIHKQQQHQAPLGFSASFSPSSVASAESSDSYTSNIGRWARGKGSSDGAWQRGFKHEVDVSVEDHSSGGSRSPSEGRCPVERHWNPLADADKGGAVGAGIGMNVSSQESFGYELWEAIDAMDCRASALSWSGSLPYRRNDGSTWGS